ncbi:MAG: peptidyl-prolyl cis-trans isomerase [Melioribacteraceae bacterium]|nr:peptidyl-prolyl cis-trans isomerase [Melioribacteraceae bacterium]
MLISQRKNRVAILSLLLLLFISCSEKKEANYVARVGDSFLTEQMINDVVNENVGNKLFREEYIRKWVEKRVIYLSAIDKGVLKNEKYLKLIDEAKVEIANAILIKELLKKNNRTIVSQELEEYFVKNISEFKLEAERFIYNQVSFSNKNAAKKFRRKLVSTNWERMVEEFSNNKALLFSAQNNLEYIYNIFPMNIRVELSKLKKNGVSGVIETSQNIFTILQLLKSYKKNDVPEFHEIEMDIREKYIAKNRKEIYNNYIKQLYSEYGSEIER